MSFENALRRYQEDRFSDRDVEHCTRLSARSWRELIKIGAVRTTGERGAGRVRLCDQKSFKRSAVMAEFHRAGFNLTMAARLGYLLPFDHLIYGLCDPIALLFDPTGKVDPETQLPPRRKNPKVDWFDPDNPAKADPKYDCRIVIFDARFVAFSYRGHEPWIYGELCENRRRFISWHPFHRQNFVHEQISIAGSKFKEFYETSLPKWDFRAEPADKVALEFLKYEYENHNDKDDPLWIAGQATMQNPVLKTSISVSLGVRKALRRYLGIEPECPVPSNWSDETRGIRYAD